MKKKKPIQAVKGTYLGSSTNTPGGQEMNYNRKGNYKEEEQ